MSLVVALRHLRHGPLRGLAPLWLVLGRLHRATLRRLPVAGTTRQWIGDYGPFAMDASFAFSDFHNWGGGHNRGFAACIEACRGKRCVFDIGAHIGLVTMPMSSVLAPGGTVHAFEPADANHRLLIDHLAKNGIANVAVTKVLIGATAATAVRFYEQAEATGVNSIVRRNDNPDYRETRCPQTTLDEFCRERGLTPEVIKIDVEGAEIDVLTGGAETLRRTRPEIFLSVHPGHLKALGRSCEELARLIADLGYDCRDMAGRPVSRFSLDEYHLLPREQADAHAV